MLPDVTAVAQGQNHLSPTIEDLQEMKYEEITDRLERQRTMKNARFYPKPSKGLVNMSKVKIQAMIVSDYKTLTALPEVFTK